MNDGTERPPPERREIVERQETITGPPHQEPADRPPGDRRALQSATIWLWLIPLLLVVVGLVWFILAEGEPRSPFEGRDVDVTTPRLEPAPPQPERTIEVPAPDPPVTLPQPDPATEPAAEPAPPPTQPGAEEGQ